jgi:NADH-quinone oxidoreductase subunit E
VRGGEEILQHCAKKLGVGHKGTTPDGLFTLEEVECIGACSWAPAAQVNYDFHENLTTEKMDRVLDKCLAQAQEQLQRIKSVDSLADTLSQRSEG